MAEATHYVGMGIGVGLLDEHVCDGVLLYKVGKVEEEGLVIGTKEFEGTALTTKAPRHQASPRISLCFLGVSVSWW